MDNTIHIWNVATAIDQSGAFNTPFRIKFVKTDGSIREMIAIKNNRHKQKTTGESTPRSNFGYNLKENFLLLLQELGEFRLGKPMKRPGVGTCQSILNPIDNLEGFNYHVDSLRPKSVPLYAILEYNGMEVFA